MGDQWVQFVRHEDIEQFEAAGWKVAEGKNLSDCHHGDWSVIMEKETEAEPEPFHWDAIDDRRATVQIVQPKPDEICIKFTNPDRECEYRRLSENQVLQLAFDLLKAHMTARAHGWRQGDRTESLRVEASD